MEVVEFLKKYARICSSHDDCGDCPLNYVDDTSNTCSVDIAKNPSKTIAIVEQWAKEHPVKTYLSVLLEVFPNVELDEDNDTPNLCPKSIFGINAKFERCALNRCKECWNREYKED